MIRSHTLSVHLRTPAVPHVNEKGPLGESSFKVKKITKLGSKSKGVMAIHSLLLTKSILEQRLPLLLACVHK